MASNSRPAIKSRRSKHSRASRRARRPSPVISLGVQLSTRSLDGRDGASRSVALVEPVRRSHSGGPNAAVSVQERKAAARRIARGCRSESLAGLLAAMAHPQRFQILLKLLGGEATHKLLARTTGCTAGPLYHHLRELRMAGLIGPKVRDLYVLTPRGGRAVLAALAVERLCR